jgi:tetratricopeptide (TPR) repeat protein
MSNADRIEELRAKYEENPRRYFAPLANEFRKAGDLAQAIAICREHLPKQPGHMSGYIVFGQTLFEANSLEEARTVFEQALSLDPENLIALKHLGDIARSKGENAVARRWYERVLDADPRNDDIAAQLASLSVPTPPLAMPAVPAPDGGTATVPTDDPNGVFATYDPNALLDVPDDMVGSAPARISWEPRPVATPRPAPMQEPIDLDFPDDPGPVDAIDGADDFEEGLLAPEWPDTADLVARLVTPVRSATPLSTPISADALAAFGRESHEATAATAAALANADLHFADRLVEAYVTPVDSAVVRDPRVDIALVDIAPADIDSAEFHAVEVAFAAADVPVEIEATPDDTHDATRDATHADVEPMFSSNAAAWLSGNDINALATVDASRTTTDATSNDATDNDSPYHDRTDSDGPYNDTTYTDTFASADTTLGGADQATHEPTHEPTQEPTHESTHDVPDDTTPETLRGAAGLNAPHAADFTEAFAINEFATGELIEEPAWADESFSQASDAPTAQREHSAPEVSFASLLDANEGVADVTPVAEESFAGMAAEVSGVHEDIAKFADDSLAPTFDGETLDLSEATLEESPDVTFGAFEAPTSNATVANDFRDDTVFVAPPSIESLFEGAPERDVAMGDADEGQTAVASESDTDWDSEMIDAPAHVHLDATTGEAAPAFVTETMAELLVAQGFIPQAIEIYEALVRRRAFDPVLTSRLAELREHLSRPDEPAAQSMHAPVHAPVHASMSATRTPAYTTPLPNASSHPTPLYNTPLRNTPVYVTPQSFTPLSVPALATTGLIASATSETSALPRVAQELGAAFRTAREHFAELARRRVPRRTPTHATAVADDAADGLSNLFGSALPTTPDELAARALADAFGPVQDSGESLFDVPPSTTQPLPLGGFTPRSNPAVHAGVGSTADAAPRTGPVDYSFDRFFPDPATPGGSTGATVPPSASSAQPPNEDLAQFSAWLKGLNNA